MPLAPNVSSQSGFKNLIINGSFAIAQRGVSFNFGSSVPTLDRWFYSSSGGSGGTAATGSISQQNFTPGQSAVPNEPASFIRFTITNTGNSLTADSYSIFSQKINEVRALAGQICTISFYAQSNIPGKKLSINVAQNFGTGGSVQAGVNGISFSLTSSWTKYSASFLYPSIAGKTIGASNYSILTFYLQAGSNLDANSASSGGLPWISTGNLDLADIQLELGSQSTKFEYRTYQAELDMCQFYYQPVYVTHRFPATAINQFGDSNIYFRNMRATPTVSFLAAGTRNNLNVAPVLAAFSSNSGRLELTSAGAGDTYTIWESFSLDAEL